MTHSPVLDGTVVAACAFFAAVLTAGSGFLPSSSTVILLFIPAALAGLLYCVRLLIPPWRPCRTAPFSEHLLALALIVLPSSLAALPRLEGLSFSFGAILLYFSFFACREAFTADSGGVFSPKMFFHSIVAAGVASVLVRYLVSPPGGAGIFSPWFNLAQETSFTDHPFLRLYDFALVLLFPIAFAGGLLESAGRRVPWLLASAIIGAGVFLSFSRSAWVALFAEGLVFFLARRSWRKTAVPILVVIALSGSFVPGARDRLSSIFDPRAATNSQRLEQWAASLDLIVRSPLVGHGLGSFGRMYRGFDGRYTDREFPNPHNLYLHLAVECGLPALFVFCSWMAWILRLLRTYGSEDGRTDGLFSRGTRLGGPAALAGFLVFGFFDL